MSTAPSPVESFQQNPRVARVEPSATLAMKARAEARMSAGHAVVSLSTGEPDFDTPAPIAEAAIQAIRDGFTHYTPNAGILELREALSEKFAAENGLDYAPDQILCSNGAKQSLALTVHVLCHPGDEVIVPAPYWTSYPQMVRLAGAEPVVVEADVEDDYRLTPAALEEAITERTRLLMLCSPSNPTGAVYPPAELEALAEVLRRHPDVFVLSDEIYERVLYDAEHRAFATLEGMKERTITVNGFSKAYAMTGWRLGYLAAERFITKAAAKVQSQFTSAPCSISQKAGVAALAMGDEPVEKMVAAFRERRDFALGRLRQIEGLRCPTPQGAFYLFPDVTAYLGRETPAGERIETSEDLCFYLLEKHDVALVPGEAFGAPSGMRLSYAASMEHLGHALDRIAAGLEALR